MSAAENHFEGLRLLVERHQPEALASFDRLAHRMRAHKDDEIFALIEAAALSATLCGQDVRAAAEENREELKALLDQHAGAILSEVGALKKALQDAAAVPAAIQEAAASVNVQTGGISQAAKEMSDVTFKVLILFCGLSAVLGGFGFVAIGKVLHWL